MLQSLNIPEFAEILFVISKRFIDLLELIPFYSAISSVSDFFIDMFELLYFALFENSRSTFKK